METRLLVLYPIFNYFFIMIGKMFTLDPAVLSDALSSEDSRLISTAALFCEFNIRSKYLVVEEVCELGGSFGGRFGIEV